MQFRLVSQEATLQNHSWLNSLEKRGELIDDIYEMFKEHHLYLILFQRIQKSMKSDNMGELWEAASAYTWEGIDCLQKD